MSLDLPAVLSPEDFPDWQRLPETGVVVVGFGIAGAAAALEAARTGADVVLLERAATSGGTSAMSGGLFYLGGGTPVQRAVGVEDSVAAMIAFLTATTREPDADKIRAYCEDSVAHFDWLEECGIEFERSFLDQRVVIQPGTEGLIYSGNEKVYPFRELAAPAPRGHKVPRPGDTGGGALAVDAIAAQLARTDAEVRFETGATALVVSEGRVVGVAWRRYDERGVLRADSVILAAGGFVGNDAMVAHYAPRLAENLFPLASSYDDGLGIRLGASAGGELRMMEQPFMTAPFYPPTPLVKGIIVNARGERFVAEDSYHARTSGFVLQQPEAKAYLIVDSAHIEHPEFALCPFIDGWETVPDMEAGLGLPTGSLSATLSSYNSAAARGADPTFHKATEWLAPQDQGPWGAYDLSVGKALYAGFTMGGLRVDVDGRVQRADLSVVDGLYAAGAAAVNIAQDALGYASGMQLGEGSYFGRRAGRHAGGRVTTRGCG